MNDKLPLEQLGRYKLVRVLGKGAMGVVYEGLDPRLNRQVAVKTILKSQLVDEDTAADYSARFVREAQAVARLSHPNIVTVFDFGEENEIAYIVMEFIRGRELKDYFDKNEFFSMDEAVRMMCELLDALDYAHKLGIIHRDIKPANLMLDASGRVKLTDFGVARLTDAGHDRTMAGTMVGTPSYMSPEQIKGEAVGPRSDLFAAGVILYQFLTRQKPFTGQGQWSIQKKILEEDPLPPSSFKAVAVPAAFDRIVKRALAKEPEDRYPSAGAFAADLKHALERARAPADDDATRVGPVPGARKGGGETPDWAQSTVQFDSTVAEKRAPAPAAAPASVDEAAKRLAEAPRPAAPAPAAPAPPPPSPPKPAAASPRVEEPPAEAPRSKMPLIAGGVGALVLVGAVAAWMLTRGGPPAAEPQPPAAAVKPATPEQPTQVAKIEPSPGKAPTEDEQARLRRLDDERRAQDEARRRDEAARQAEEAEKRKAAEDAAKAKAPADDAKARAQEDAKRKADEAARRKADDAAQKKAQDEAQRKAAEEARLKTEQEAKLKAEQEAKLKSEQDAKAKVEQDAKAKADQDAKAKAEQEARRKADEEAKKKAAEDEVKRKAAEADAARKARTPADLIAEASQLERDGKFAQAVRLYKDAAGKGSGPAAKKLGEIYGRGAGDVGRDYAESVKWYSVARERGESVPTPR